MGKRAIVDFPINVAEIEKEDGVEYVAESVYSLETIYTPNLEDRINANFEQWLNNAKAVKPQETTLADVVEALNALTEIVLGGEV